MDPNKALQELRDLCKESDETFIHAGYLADLFRNLDNWVSDGGFLPTDWDQQCSNICCEI